MKCPKCGFEQEDGLEECMRCGIVFRKYEEVMRKRQQYLSSTYSPTTVVVKEKSESVEPAISREDMEILKNLYRELGNFVGGFKEQRVLVESIKEDLSNQREKLKLLSEEVESALSNLKELKEKIDRELENFSEDNFKKLDDITSFLEGINEKVDNLSSFDDAPYLKKLEELHENLKRLKNNGDVGDVDNLMGDINSIKEEIGILQAEVRNIIDGKGNGVAEDVVEDRLKEFEVKLNDRFLNLDETIKSLERKIDELDGNFKGDGEDLSGYVKNVVEEHFKIEKDRFENLMKDMEKIKSDFLKLKEVFKEFGNTLSKLSEMEEDKK